MKPEKRLEGQSRLKKLTTKPKMREKDVNRLIADYLSAKRVLFFRMNTGALKMDKRFIRFGTPGMADFVAFRRCPVNLTPEVVWVESKAPKGKQSALQSDFEKLVKAEGHEYIVVRELADLVEVFK